MNHQNRPFSRCPCNRFSRTLIGIGRKRSEEMPGNDPCMRRNDNTGARRPKAPKVDDIVRHLTQRILKARAGWRGHARPLDSCVAASHSWWPCCDVHRGSHHTTEPRGASREETTNCVRVHPDVPMGDDNPVGQHLVRYVGLCIPIFSTTSLAHSRPRWSSWPSAGQVTSFRPSEFSLGLPVLGHWF